MKRSEIHAIMCEADAFIRQRGFLLPPFAYWCPETWATKGEENREIVERQLGWDITDFGQDDFSKIGLFLFPIRNGTIEALKRGAGKVYAEKILIVDVGQVTPMHFHWTKKDCSAGRTNPAAHASLRRMLGMCAAYPNRNHRNAKN